MAQMRHFLENGCVKVRTMGSEPEGGCAPAHPLTLHIAVPRDAGNAKETGRDQRYRSRQMHRMRDLLHRRCSLDVFRLDTDQSKVSPLPPAACPAGTDIRGYNALVQQGKLEEAAQKLRQANPFPGITGRICFHPCEKECARNAVDGAVNINAVEQFLGNLDLPEEQPAVRHTAKVAVVGSGPAGLSCACFMARMGYPVTVFEAAPRPGGMLRYGIPAYRTARRRGRSACGPA